MSWSGVTGTEVSGAGHLVSPSHIDPGLKLPLVLKMTLALFVILFLDLDIHNSMGLNCFNTG